MISDEVAHKLKVFLWAELPIEALKKIPQDVITEINKVIDKAIVPKKELAA